MKRFDDTLSLSITDILAYRPLDGPVPPAPIAPYAPPASEPALTWQECKRIAADHLRSSWAALRTFGAYLWGRNLTAQELAERTITIEIPAIATTPEARRRHIVAITAMVVMALLVALGLGMTTRPAPALAKVVTTHVNPRLTVFHCATVHGARVCRMTSNNWGYCSKIHYPQQDKHCKTLLPPKGK